MFIFLAFLCLISCKQKKVKDYSSPMNQVNILEVEEEDFFKDYQYGDVKRDTLYLNITLDDCGEWGGPKENIKIYVDSKDNYQLEYKRFKFNCDSIGYYYNQRSPLLDYKKVITLNKKEKDIVSSFFVDLMKAKINEEVYSNAGSVYQLFDRDSTLYLDIHSERKTIMKKFLGFKESLDLKK